MTNDTKPIPAGVLPELPAHIGQIIGTRLTPVDTTEFWGYWAKGYKTELKQLVYTADQMRAYATEAVKQSLAQPAATYDSERAAMVAKYGGGGEVVSRIVCWCEGRIFLDELKQGTGRYQDEPEIQCGVFCEAAQKEIAE